MKKLLICLLMLLSACSPDAKKNYAYSRVVRLQGNGHGCSGEQVHAPSGRDYILTAGHCSVLADKDGYMVAIDENRDYHKVKIVEEDSKSDLLLLEGLPFVRGFDVAAGRSANQHVRTFTHGAGRDAYETEGVLLWDEHVKIGMDRPILSEKDAATCVGDKYEVVSSIFGSECALSVTETASTAYTTFGSSGGVIVNDSDELVGVVSAGNGKYSLFVMVSDIHNFLRSK